MTETQTLDQALAYAAAGWPVFPTRPGDPACQGGKGCECKAPFPKTHGVLEASTDPDRIRAWWRSWPAANVAIAAGAPGPDVLDVDVHEDGSGFVAFNRLKREGILGMPGGPSALVRTPSGGLHAYFTGTSQRNGGLPKHHIDFRGRGGYVLAPPSRIHGTRYELWQHRAVGGHLDWDAVTRLLEPPRPVRRREARPMAPGGKLPPLVRWALEAPAPDRSAALHRLVGACVDAGLDEPAIHEIAAGYEPAVSKYGPRLHTEVDRSARKVTR